MARVSQAQFAVRSSNWKVVVEVQGFKLSVLTRGTPDALEKVCLVPILPGVAYIKERLPTSQVSPFSPSRYLQSYQSLSQ